MFTDEEAAQRGQLIRDYYAACDVQDWDAIKSYLHPQVEFRNANGAPTYSVADLQERVVAAMRDVTLMEHSVGSIVHDIGGRQSAAELNVRLEKSDGRKFEGPACGMFWFNEDGLVECYHAYIDEGDFWQ